MKNITNRTKQAIKTKKRIYNCGIELIQSNGFDQVTVEEIAKKAQVSVGTFYHYFSSKFDLLAEIFRRADAFFKENTQYIFESPKSYPEKIIDYFKLYAKLSLEEGLEKVKKLYVPTNQMFLTHGRAMQDLLTNLINEAQINNAIDTSICAELITKQLFVAARGVIFDWCLHNGKSDISGDMEDMIGRLIQTYIV